MPSSGEGPGELVSVPRTKPLTCVKVKACAGAASVTESARALAVASSLDIFSPIIANSPLGPAFAQDLVQEPYQVNQFVTIHTLEPGGEASGPVIVKITDRCRGGGVQTLEIEQLKVSVLSAEERERSAAPRSAAPPMVGGDRYLSGEKADGITIFVS